MSTTTCPLARRVDFAVGHAAEQVVIEWDYTEETRFADATFNAAYWMAAEILAALLDVDGEPAKAVLDREIARLLDGKTAEYGMPSPDPGTAMSFDEVEAAGLDGTLRSM